MKFLSKNKIVIYATIIGTALGFLYWQQWGCENGCTLKSSPLIMSLYGAFFGYAIGGWIQQLKNKKNNNEILN